MDGVGVDIALMAGGMVVAAHGTVTMEPIIGLPLR